MSLAQKLDWNTIKNQKNQQQYIKKEIQIYIKSNHNKIYDRIDFDSVKIYSDYVSEINLCGKRQWFHPTYAATFDLKNSKINEHEDVIVYHGVKNPNHSLRPILQEGFKAGGGQAYANQKDFSGQSQIPVGVYASQFMNTTLGYTDPSNQVVFQCAARNIFLTKLKDYLVSTSIRPIKLVFPFSGIKRQIME